MKKLAWAVLAVVLLAPVLGRAQEIGPGPGMSPNGSNAKSPVFPASGITYAFGSLQTMTGNYSATASFNNNTFNCSSDDIAITNSTVGFVDCFTIVHNFGGSSAIGGREPLAVYGTLTAPTSSSNTNRNYAAINAIMIANSDDGALVAKTTLSSTVSQSATTTQFTSLSPNTTGMTAGDLVTISGNNGYTVGATIKTIDSSSALTINGSLPFTASAGTSYIKDTTAGITVSIQAAVSATSDTTALSVNSITNFANGDLVGLVLDTGQVYTTTIQGAPSGSTITILGDLTSQASSGATLYDLKVTASKGAIFSYGNAASLAVPGAANFLNLTGSEFNVTAVPGSSVFYKSGIQIALGSDDAVQGATYDCGVCISSKTGLSAFHDGILFGNMNGFYPVSRTGTLIRAVGSHIYGTGIDISAPSYLTAAIKSPGFTVGTSGSITATFTTDSGHTTATTCEDTTSHQMYFGSGTAGVCAGTSSARFKTAIGALTYGLLDFLWIDPVSFVYKAGYGDNSGPDPKPRWQVGFTAEQMQTVLPGLVQVDADGRPQSVDYLGMVPYIVRWLQGIQYQLFVLYAVVLLLIAIVIALHRRMRLMWQTIELLSRQAEVD